MDTMSEYSVCLANPTGSSRQYWMGCQPDQWIHPMNIQWVSGWSDQTVQVILDSLPGWVQVLNHLHVFTLVNTLPKPIEYFLCSCVVIYGLYKLISSLDSIRYWISDVGKAYKLLILIGHVIYVYYVLFCRYILYIYYVQSSRRPLARLKWYNVIILSTYLSCIRTGWCASWGAQRWELRQRG